MANTCDDARSVCYGVDGAPCTYSHKKPGHPVTFSQELLPKPTYNIMRHVSGVDSRFRCRKCDAVACARPYIASTPSPDMRADELGGSRGGSGSGAW